MGRKPLVSTPGLLALVGCMTEEPKLGRSQGNIRGWFRAPPLPLLSPLSVRSETSGLRRHHSASFTLCVQTLHRSLSSGAGNKHSSQLEDAPRASDLKQRRERLDWTWNTRRGKALDFELFRREVKDLRRSRGLRNLTASVGALGRRGRRGRRGVGGRGTSGTELV